MQARGQTEAQPSQTECEGNIRKIANFVSIFEISPPPLQKINTASGLIESIPIGEGKLRESIAKVAKCEVIE